MAHLQCPLAEVKGANAAVHGNRKSLSTPRSSAVTSSRLLAEREHTRGAALDGLPLARIPATCAPHVPLTFHLSSRQKTESLSLEVEGAVRFYVYPSLHLTQLPCELRATPRSEAAIMGQVETVGTLVQMGADKDSKKCCWRDAAARGWVDGGRRQGRTCAPTLVVPVAHTSSSVGAEASRTPEPASKCST